MSFRPTIAVYAEGKIADLGYYRNWDEPDLFFEAIAIAAIFNQCKSIEEYREKKFNTQKVNYLLDPVAIENTQENLRELEECSECPILIDLSSGYIYNHIGPLLPEELNEIPTADIENVFAGENMDYSTLLLDYKISLRKIDYGKVKNILLELPEMRKRLSTETLRLLMEDVEQHKQRDGEANE